MASELGTKVNILHFYNDYRLNNQKEFFKVYPVNNDVLMIDCIITGKPGTIWEGGQFDLQLSFPQGFPASPPQAKFIPAIYHPNVNNDGTIKLSLLDPSKWKKETTMMEILSSAQTILNEPDTESAVNNDANNAYLRYKKDSSDDEYVKTVKEIVSKSKNNPRESTTPQSSGASKQNLFSGASNSSNQGFGNKSSNQGFGNKSSNQGFGFKSSNQSSQGWGGGGRGGWGAPSNQKKSSGFGFSNEARSQQQQKPTSAFSSKFGSSFQESQPQKPSEPPSKASFGYSQQQSQQQKPNESLPSKSQEPQQQKPAESLPSKSQEPQQQKPAESLPSKSQEPQQQKSTGFFSSKSSFGNPQQQSQQQKPNESLPSKSPFSNPTREPQQKSGFGSKFSFNSKTEEQKQKNENANNSSPFSKPSQASTTSNSPAQEIERLKAENERLQKENEFYRKRFESLEFNGLELIESKTINELANEGTTNVTVDGFESHKVQRAQRYTLIIHKNVNKTSQALQKLIKDNQVLHNVNHRNIQRAISYNISDNLSILFQFVPYNLGDVIGGLSNSWKSMAVYEVCQAMEAAHKAGVIHRNLNPLNILFDEAGHVKISEFGLANMISLKNQAQQTVGGVENARFMAPELLNDNQNYDNKVDVYSFAVFVYFILTGGELPSISIKSQAEGKKAKLPNKINQVSRDLINRCWETRPQDRPSFTEIIEYIRQNKFNLIDGVENELDQIKSFLSL